MNETAPTTTAVRPEDIEAAKELAKEAGSTDDVTTLREMLVDQNAGTTTITAEDGSEIEVTSIGREKFAELGQKASQSVVDNLAVDSETWHTEEK